MNDRTTPEDDLFEFAANPANPSTGLEHTVQQVHRALTAGSHAMPDSIRQQIREDLMPSATVSNAGFASPSVTATPNAPVRPARPIDAPRCRVVDTIARWQPVVSMTIVVALLASVIALTYQRGVLDDPDESGTFGAIVPDGTPDSLLPVSEDACDVVAPRPVHELAAMRLGPVPDRNEPFVPVSPAPDELAENIAQAGRRYLACKLNGNALEYSALETEAYIAWFPQQNMIRDIDIYIERQQDVRALSEKVMSGNLADYWVQTDALPPLDPIDSTGSDQPRTLISEQVVRLADERLGAPIVTLINPNVTVSMPESGLVRAPFYIFAEDPGEPGSWLLDEVVTLCLGACDPYWASPGDYPAGSPLSSPVFIVDGVGLTAVTQEANLYPAPAATPLADLYPVAIATDCTVDSRPLETIRALQHEPGQRPPRDYVPVESADPVLAGEIVSTALTWRACSGWGKPSQRIAMESPWLIAGEAPESTPTLADQERLQDERNEFAASILGDDWTRWFVETTALGEYVPTAAIQTPQDHRSFILPGDVYLLPDGRAAGTVTKLVPVGYHDAMAMSADHAIEVHIFIRDPTQNGRWVLDEMLWLQVPDATPIPGQAATIPGRRLNP